MRMPPDLEDDDEGPEVPSELAGVILHRSIKRRVKDEDDEDDEDEPEEDATGGDGLDEDDIAALGG